MEKMSEEEIREVAAKYFGFGPAIKKDSVEIELIDPEDTGETVRIKWEEHIGALSGVARVSDRDIMHELGLECGDANKERAVRVMKSVAHRSKAYLVRVNGTRYLLINPRYRR
ncbi:MAG: hypothetical protein GXO25_02510 [Euryarchaeota archaeon]|nr:hypothetical protein [Euryarchaeota archaeon]